jgi:2-polyprenyl-3-methyl-5-hydroxy-6-metoxy-1,4-benzoquinol methylase
MWPDLAERRREPEWMDDPSLPAADHDAALRGLARLNVAARSHMILWRPLERLARSASREGRPLRVLDVATGSGDLPLAMARRARRLGLEIQWSVCDASAHALDTARQRAMRAGFDLTVHRLDATVDELPATDVSTCSLFVHHLDPPQVTGLLARMRRASAMALGVNDLDRSRLGYVLAWISGRLLSRSPVVHHDAPVSVQGGFRMEEIARLAWSAGLVDARLDRTWPARWRLWWQA